MRGGERGELEQAWKFIRGEEGGVVDDESW